MTDAPRTLLIIRNPRARRAGNERELWEATDLLRSLGWQVAIETTAAPGDGVQLAAAAAERGTKVVAAYGGDGTVHEVVNGIAYTDTALAVIPAGTADVWAREAFVPRDVRRALRLIALGRRERVDLGVVEGAFGRRHFLLMCGIGLDAEVVRRVGAGSTGKRRLGKGWYGLRAVGAIVGAQAAGTTLVVDSTSLERPLLQAVAGNTRLYGGVMHITSDARVDDGLLDLCVFSGHGRVHRLGLVARTLRGRLHQRSGRGVEYLRAGCIEVRSERPLPLQADGEYLGETPATLSVAPRALTVLLAPRANVLLGEA
jgi:YegS/Rv2252/BmrU family lipid kinase